MTKTYLEKIDDTAEKRCSLASKRYDEIQRKNKENGIELTNDEKIDLYLNLCWEEDGDEEDNI